MYNLNDKGKESVYFRVTSRETCIPVYYHPKGSELVGEFRVEVLKEKRRKNLKRSPCFLPHT